MDVVTPPPALRQRILASLASQPQEAPRSPVESNGVTMPPHRVKSRRGVHPGWLAAAALVILGLGTALYSSIAIPRLLVDDVQQAQAAAADAQTMVVDLRRQLDQDAGQADLAVSILTASDTQPIAMAGRENATGFTARAYRSPTRGLLIVADDLPVPPPGRIHQV